jgi:hypothetical protein
LKLALSSDVVFTKYAKRLAEDTKRAEKDVAFRSTMNLVYFQMMDASEEPLPDDFYQKFDVARITDFDVSRVSGFMGLARAWGLISSVQSKPDTRNDPENNSKSTGDLCCI